MNIFAGVVAAVITYLLVDIPLDGPWPLLAGLVVFGAIAFGWDRYTRR